jgi:hypothetical protein
LPTKQKKTNEDFKKNYSIFYSYFVYAYNECTKSISGKVTDSSGFPLAGTTILVKGTKSATVTNEMELQY